MPIRWDPTPIKEALDACEAAFKEAEPCLLKAAGVAQDATGQAKLPQYMTEDLKSIVRDLQDMARRFRQNIERARKAIPNTAVAKTRRQDGPKLL